MDSPSTRLTPSQLAFLRRCVNGPTSSWDAGAATVSSLRKLGYIRAEKAKGVTVNVITDVGRQALVIAQVFDGA